MFRKIIYMGKCGEGAVYFDTEQQCPLLAQKSKLLNTEGARRTNRLIVPIIVSASLGGSSLIFANSFGGYYSESTLIFLIAVWLMECFGLIWLVERALYKNVKEAIPTTRENFRRAVYSNLFWNNFSDKKVTIGKKVWAWIMTGTMLLLSFSPLLIIKVGFNMLSNAIGSEIIGISFIGIMSAIAFIMIWQNNPIRWLNIVEKYQKRQINWQW